MSVPRVAHSPYFWLSSFLAWFLALWALSSMALITTGGPEIPGLDKVLHFGYFFGGAGLLSPALFLLRYRPGISFHWPTLVLLVVIILAAVGALDEWHQSWTPERTGNDPADWLADVLGALAGALVFRRFHRLLLPPAVAGDR
ncbi:MAG: VanZ family protein [Akkermansiaceae bacterium]|nr:VanZ family protein [Akkermansiaceae bacterium]